MAAKNAENIDEVVDGLAGIVREAVRSGDRVGYFAALYRQVTAEVRAGIHAGLFDDGARMDRFDTFFGNRYFDAYDTWRRDRAGPAAGVRRSGCSTTATRSSSSTCCSA
ncbi:DUF5995 family protein [Streptomyces stelliscabiei]|uniref:DUF5995 family protein n=1 Tax=Streptomyces stelliscabiei TaxID=146820 RepID=UPI002FF417BA